MLRSNEPQTTRGGPATPREHRIHDAHSTHAHGTDAHSTDAHSTDAHSTDAQGAHGAQAQGADAHRTPRGRAVTGRRRYRIAIIAFVIALLAAPVQVALAELPPDVEAQAETQVEPEAEAQAEEPLVSNVFIDTDLRQALQDVGVQAGVNVILDPSVGGVITAELDEVPLGRAIDTLLSGTGFEAIQINDFYLVYSPDPSSDAFLETSRMKRVKLDNVTAETARNMLSSRLQSYVRADPDSNSLAITASPRITARIMEDIAEIDVPKKHVLLDARMVVLEETDMFSLGVDWSPPGVTAGAYTDDREREGGGLSWPWGVQIGYTPGRDFTNALRMTLNLMEENDEARVISSPQVMGQDGGTAEIRVTTEEYFEITTEGATQIRSQLETIETGALLKITPRIGDDNTVQLDLEVDVSDVVSRGEQNLPVVSRRAAQTTVKVDSGGTVAVGGLMDSRAQTGERAVPFLGRIPLLGRLFSSESQSNASRQVAVFVTATVVESDDEEFRSGNASRPRGSAVPEREFREAIREFLDTRTEG